jgi:hypothetical protein
MIEDWELGVLYLKERDRKASEQLAAQSVKEKYLNWMFSKERDPLLFMGTTFPYNSWVVIGVFYPPRQRQGLWIRLPDSRHKMASSLRHLIT